MNKVTKTLLSFLLAILLAPALWGQAVPQGITYQAVACDNAGVELIKQKIRVRASIQKDGPNGQALWIEDHAFAPSGQSLMTDDFGLFTLIIGTGTKSGGTVANFADIDWSYGNLWLKMEMDPTGVTGAPHNFIGANRIWSVPYAFLAKDATRAATADVALNATTANTALDDLDKDPKNEIQDLKWDPATGTLSLVPSTGLPVPPLVLDGSNTNELQTLSIDANGNLVLSPSAPGSTPLDLNDDDKDPTNELQKLVYDPGTGTLTLSPPSGGGNPAPPIAFDPSSTNELQSLVYDPATGNISLSPSLPNQLPINLGDNDKDPLNELQELKWDPLTNTITIVKTGTGGGGNIILNGLSKDLQWDPINKLLKLVPAGQGSQSVSLPDDSNTNELQEIKFDPNTKVLSLAPLGQGTPGFVLPDDSPINELQELKWDPATKSISIVKQGQGGSSLISGIGSELKWDPITKTLQLVPVGQGSSGVSLPDDSPTNELQQLSWDPINQTLSLVPGGSGTSVISIPAGDNSSTNELQTINYNAATNTITLTPAGPNGQNSIVLDDNDKNPTNEIQTLNYNSTTNKVSISGVTGPGSEFTINDGDKDPTNEIQTLQFNPNTKELSISGTAGSNPPSVFLTDGDSNPTNELQGLTFDSLTRTISIWPPPVNGNGSIKLALSTPGNNDFPQVVGKPDYMVLLDNTYTVPPGKTLFITAAGATLKLFTPFGQVIHANSPAMPVLPAGTSISECYCTAFQTNTNPDWTPIVIDFNDPAYSNGYTIPPGKVFVIKSGIAIDFGRIDVSLDNGSNWHTLIVALSPYEASSRAPTFPAGVRLRPSYNVKYVLTGYLFNY